MKKVRITEQGNLFGVAITIAVLVALSLFIDVEILKDYVAQAGPWAPLAFIVMKIATIIVAPLSGAPLYPLVGFLFGFFPGLLYIVIGDFIGHSLAFFISRTFGEPLVRKFVSTKENSLLAKIVKHVGTAKGLLHTCLTCFALPELISYGAGLSRIRYTTFISILMSFMILGSAVLVSLGVFLDLSNQSTLVSFGMPIVFIIIALIGGTLFVRSVSKLETKKDI